MTARDPADLIARARAWPSVTMPSTAAAVNDGYALMLELAAALERAEQSNATLTKAWYAAREERDRLRRLVKEHHAIGVFDGALIGDQCVVCAREELKAQMFGEADTP